MMENLQPTNPQLLFERLHDADSVSWMTRTRKWLDDQGTQGPPLVSQTTREWVWAQQQLDAQRGEAARRRERQRKWWEETVRSVDGQARQWMADAEARRQAAQRETEKTRQVQEEVRQVRRRGELLEARRRKMQEEARRLGERVALAAAWVEREQATRELRAAWERYEGGWAALQAAPKARLAFDTIPWPLVVPPTTPASISNEDVAAFLLSPLHSGNKSGKDRIRDAMQRWHNDKFEPRVLPRVVEPDKNAVKEGVDIVVRCLNDLLVRQTTQAQAQTQNA